MVGLFLPRNCFHYWSLCECELLNSKSFVMVHSEWDSFNVFVGGDVWEIFERPGTDHFTLEPPMMSLWIWTFRCLMDLDYHKFMSFLLLLACHSIRNGARRHDWNKFTMSIRTLPEFWFIVTLLSLNEKAAKLLIDYKTIFLPNKLRDFILRGGSAAVSFHVSTLIKNISR